MGIDLEALGQFGKILTRGVASKMAPSVLQGALVKLLEPVTMDKAIDWVNNNTSLWDTMGPKYQEGLLSLAQHAGKMDWLTADWIIDAIRKDCPALASLFLGWRKAHNWLTRQVEIIQREVKV